MSPMLMVNIMFATKMHMGQVIIYYLFEKQHIYGLIWLDHVSCGFSRNVLLYLVISYHIQPSPAVASSVKHGLAMDSYGQIVPAMNSYDRSSYPVMTRYGLPGRSG